MTGSSLDDLGEEDAAGTALNIMRSTRFISLHYVHIWVRADVCIFRSISGPYLHQLPTRGISDSQGKNRGSTGVSWLRLELSLSACLRIEVFRQNFAGILQNYCR
jgi:hypothetical protein